MIEKTYPIAETLLNKTLTLTTQLLELLNKEASALQQRKQAQIITSLATDKKSTVAQLEQLNKQLSQVLATEQLKLDAPGIEHYLEKADQRGIATANCRLQWQNILMLAKQCQMLNEKNGASIRLLQHHNQRSLNLLRGKKPTASTYGRDGSTYNERFSQALYSV